MSISGGIVINRRIASLRKGQDRDAAFEPSDLWSEFNIAAACPPDKRLYIRRGIVSAEVRIGAVVQNDFIPDWVCDFENEAETQLSLNFTNAGYYLPVILCYYWEWLLYRTYRPATYAEPVFDSVVGTEVATTQEAEAQIDALLNGHTQWYYYRMPLWSVILRNDGLVSVDYAILPIDAANRGRSYLYRDARAKYAIFP